MSQANQALENRFKKILIWSLINRKMHKFLLEQEVGHDVYVPLVEALFPGIKYEHNRLNEIVSRLIIPTLNKLFPEIKGLSEDDIDSEEMIEVEVFLSLVGH